MDLMEGIIGFGFDVSVGVFFPAEKMFWVSKSSHADRNGRWNNLKQPTYIYTIYISMNQYMDI